MKYFLFGGMSAAFLLFGFSLIYGLTGSIELHEISAHLAGHPPTPLLSVALVMVLVAFGFKAAAAPFHLWAPDVYEGAPVSSSALIASASKLAGLTLFVRLYGPASDPAPATSRPPPVHPAGWLSSRAFPPPRSCWEILPPSHSLICAACSPTPPSPTPGLCSSA